MKKEQSSRVIVITGASAGVGRATAQAFARTEGARIGLIARGMEGLEGAKRDVESLGGQAVVLPCQQAEFDELTAIEVVGQLLKDLVADRAVNDELVGGA